MRKGQILIDVNQSQYLMRENLRQSRAFSLSLNGDVMKILGTIQEKSDQVLIKSRRSKKAALKNLVAAIDQIH